jgi:hypothetical protein
MVAYRMLYALAVGLPVLLAAAVGAAALRGHGRAERGLWLVGLCLALLLPAVLLVRHHTGGHVSETTPHKRA